MLWDLLRRSWQTFSVTILLISQQATFNFRLNKLLTIQKVTHCSQDQNTGSYLTVTTKVAKITTELCKC